MENSLFKHAGLMFLLMVATYLVYAPGLNGGFLLDDRANLSKLQLLDGDVNWAHLQDYLAASNSGPLKRPISLLSFAADAQDWPADPTVFKSTNLKIHILNGLLLYFLIYLIFANKASLQVRVTVLAFFSAAIWLLHPLLLSTTLYVVQRMAMLPLTFMLIGLSLYVYSRKQYMESQGKTAVWLLLCSVFGMTLLSILSKENGILYLLQVALFEYFIIQRYLGWPKLSKRLSRLLLVAPVLLVLLLIAVQMPKYLNWYEVERFSMYERLLSQFRVLTQYWYHLVIPDYFTLGIFGDAFQVSKGLLKPATTLFSVLFILGLLVLAWFCRNKYLWFSFAVFFYFVSQLLESTVVPLELYFEHRNYIAAVFLPVPLMLLIERYARNKNILLLIPIGLCLYLGFNTLLRANVWSDNLRLHESSLEKYPESSRAATLTANIYAHQGDYQRAMDILEQSPMYGRQLQIQLNHILLKCNLSVPVGADMLALQQSFAAIKFTDQDAVPYTLLLRKTLRDNCGEPQQDYSQMLLNMLQSNPAAANQGSKDLLKFYAAMVLIERRQMAQAEPVLLDVAKSYQSYPSLLNLVDAAIKRGGHDMAAKALRVIRDRYEQEYRYKPDLSQTGKKILLLETKNANHHE